VSVERWWNDNDKKTKLHKENSAPVFLSQIICWYITNLLEV